MFHAVFLMYMAYVMFNRIYDAMMHYAESRGALNAVTNIDGIRCLLFGIMMGTSGYFSGTALGTSSDIIL